MTIGEACDTHYLPYAIDLAESTRGKLRYHFRRWERLVGKIDIADITPETFAEYRRVSLEAGLCARSIETVIVDVLTVLRRCEALGLIDKLPSAGRRLRRRQTIPKQPTLEEMGAVWRHCQAATWPTKPGAYGTAEDFWRAWFATAYFTGFRLGDLLQLSWDRVSLDANIVEGQALKTGKVVRLPIHPVLRERLAMVPDLLRRGMVFPVYRNPKYYRAALRQICASAMVPKITPKMIRRAAGTQAEKGRAGSGALILGHSLSGATRFYIESETLLGEAIDNMPVPPGWPSQYNDRDADQESRLVRDYRSLPARDRETIQSLMSRLKN